jgi:ribosome-interacting GTPase 1
MPSNISAEAKNKWAQVAACHSAPEKIRLMREFISLVPRHKGTEKLLGNVRRRIRVLEDEVEKTRIRRKGSRAGGFSVPKEGAGQIIVLGATKVGRSSLLAKVTNAKVEPSPIPFATRKPVVGMLPYQNVQFQLVEAPAIVEGSAQGKMDGSQILGLARNADGLALMIDLSENPVGQFWTLRSELEKSGVLIGKSEGEVEVTRRSAGASVQVVGGGMLVDCTLDGIMRMLESYRINSAVVRVRGKVALDDIEASLFSSTVYKPALILANKVDAPKADAALQSLKQELGDVEVPVLPVSCLSGQGLTELGGRIFRILGIIRIYTKEPSDREASPNPIVAKEGTTAIDIAKELHSSLYRRFQYGRVWGRSAKYPGQKVGSSHVLKDGDTLEIH